MTDRDHARGPARAPVTLVEYGDYECPFCGRAFYVLRATEDRFRRDLRFVFRHFPLAELHPHAVLAAEASEAAAVQGRFWRMHDMLFENQDDLTLPALIAYARESDLDVDAFTNDLENHRHIELIRDAFMGGVHSGVNGTPSVFINGEPFEGPVEEEPLTRAIEAARSVGGRDEAHRGSVR